MTPENRLAGSLPKYLNYAVLKVDSYSNKIIGEDCFPGIIRGQAIGGALDGKTISIALRKTLTNHRVTKIADLQNEECMSHTPIGGYIAFEGLRIESNKVTAQWLNRMGGPDSILRSGMPTQIAPIYNEDGKLRRFQANGATIYNAQILNMMESKTVNSKDDLQENLTNILEENGSALVALAPHQDVDGDSLPRQTHMAVVGWRDQSQISAEEATEKFMGRHDSFDPYLITGANVDIIPMKIYRLGSRVCETIDAGGKQAVPISRYFTGGLGARIQSTLRRFDTSVGEKIESAFLNQASNKTKDSFATLGWKGVWNSDITEFFDSANCALPKVTKFGFAVSTTFLKPYSDEGEELYVTKARPLTAALPRNAIPTPSDQSANARYYDSIYQAVSKLAKDLSSEQLKTLEINSEDSDLGTSIHHQNDVNPEGLPDIDGPEKNEDDFQLGHIDIGLDKHMNF